jgi:hypothetical protein
MQEIKTVADLKVACPFYLSLFIAKFAGQR